MSMTGALQRKTHAYLSTKLLNCIFKIISRINTLILTVKIISGKPQLDRGRQVHSLGGFVWFCEYCVKKRCLKSFFMDVLLPLLIISSWFHKFLPIIARYDEIAVTNVRYNLVFSLGKTFQQRLMFARKIGATSIRLGWKGLTMINTNLVNYIRKSFIQLGLDKIGSRQNIKI